MRDFFLWRHNTCIYSCQEGKQQLKEKLSQIPSWWTKELLLGLIMGMGEGIIQEQGWYKMRKVTEKPTSYRWGPTEAASEGLSVLLTGSLTGLRASCLQPPWLVSLSSKVSDASVAWWLGLVEQSVPRNLASFSSPRHREACLPPESHELFSSSLLEGMFQFRRIYYMPIFH